MGLFLKVGVNAGSSIEQTARDMVDLASRLALTIEADFNGVLLMAFPQGDPAALARNWHTELASKKSHKIATSVDRGTPTHD